MKSATTQLLPLPDFSIAWAAWSNPNQDHGYSHVGFKLFEQLTHQPGIKNHHMYQFGWDAMVVVSTPAAWLLGPAPCKRPDLVIHTMFEASPLPPYWVDNLNLAGLVWAPTQYWADEFRAQGVTTPIMVSGYGVDGHIYQFVDRSRRQKDPLRPFKVLVWSELPISRKNALLAMEVFHRAKLPNAVLELKVMEFPGYQKGTTRFTGSDGLEINAQVYTGSWPRRRLVSWLHSGDVGLYLSGGEGFGLMPLEMMATGLPVICSDNTGMSHYLNEAIGMRVRTKEMRSSPAYKAAYGYDAKTAWPDIDQAVAHLRWAYEHRGLAHQMGLRAAEYVRSTFTWEQAGEQAAFLLRQHFKKL